MELCSHFLRLAVDIGSKFLVNWIIGDWLVDKDRLRLFRELKLLLQHSYFLIFGLHLLRKIKRDILGAVMHGAVGAIKAGSTGLEYRKIFNDSRKTAKKGL